MATLTTPGAPMSAATSPTPTPQSTETHWSGGLTEGERGDVMAHLVGWFSAADPAEFAKALDGALKQVESDRARDAERRAARGES